MAPLLEDNPFIGRLVLLRRRNAAASSKAGTSLRAERYEFRGRTFKALIKSPWRLRGAPGRHLRASIAASFASAPPRSSTPHDGQPRRARGSKRTSTWPPPRRRQSVTDVSVPGGPSEAALPPGRFVLASPLARPCQAVAHRTLPSAGRASSSATSDIPLVLDGPPGSGLDHCSGLPGLIHATRRPRAIGGRR